MKKLSFIIFLFILSIVSYSLNFSVMPTGFVVDLDKVSTQEVYITNNTSAPLRLEAYFQSDANFGENFNLNSNSVIFPKIIAIKPGAKQTIRFRTKPNSDMKDGEYKSYLTFKEIPQEIKSIPGEDSSNKTAMSTNLQMITEISISVFGQRGKQISKGALNNLKLNYIGDSLIATAETFSDGNASIKFYYSLKILNSDTELEGMLGMSSREGKKMINISIDPGMNLKGKKIKFIVTDQDGKIYYDKVHTL
ncbi:molecular chaperone [Fusobacterium sp.]|uniref:fimbrial biogenesis chaperone n=1 Tax=Fusobacterium sp. TaxID=68766 RepID=UPI0028FEE5A0|nr:fimbria/pilus periplasmic chaperone [Fusobacterium sp.]MDU1910500.1 fimbria/pilus periplasmic chaperone [Fusobacterium sp.]